MTPNKKQTQYTLGSVVHLPSLEVSSIFRILCVTRRKLQTLWHLAPPRNTKDRKHLQSRQSADNRHTSQTKHQELSKGQPERRITTMNTAAVHASAHQPAIITLTHEGHHQILSANSALCEA